MILFYVKSSIVSRDPILNQRPGGRKNADHGNVATRKRCRDGLGCPTVVACALAFMLAVIGYPCEICEGRHRRCERKSTEFAPLRSDDRGYYVEFRARTDNEFGHSYVVVGAVDRQGRGRRLGTVGFGTATGAPSGLNAVFGSRGQIGYTNDDIVQKPIESFRISIDRATVRGIVRTTAAMRRTWTSYSLLTRNCNTFVGAIATRAGLDVPYYDAVQPDTYVRELRRLNSASAPVTRSNP